mgnify:CR=1 FL=1
MSGSPAFEWLCSELQQRTKLTQVQARGTVRLMLSDAGLDPNHLRKNQLLVLIERLIDNQSQDVFELISDVILTKIFFFYFFKKFFPSQKFDFQLFSTNKTTKYPA